MNKSRIIVLWLMLAMFAYGLESVPNWVFMAMVVPAVLAHLWITTRKQREWNRTINETMENGPPENPLGAEQIVVDEEFEEYVELEIGGHISLEGWNEREIEMSNVEPGETVKTELTYQGENGGYQELRVKK